MLTKIHRLFWFAYYFFFNLFTGQYDVQKNQNEKKDVACSTVPLKMHEGICFNRSKQRWQRKMAKVVPHVWKMVIAKQMNTSCFIKKSDPKLKFIPIQLWPEVEPSLSNALVIFTCMLAAKAAAKAKAHKGTQLSKKEPIFDTVENDDKKSLVINCQNEKTDNIILDNQTTNSNMNIFQEIVATKDEKKNEEIGNSNDEKLKNDVTEEILSDSGKNPEKQKNEQLEEYANVEENGEKNVEETLKQQFPEKITLNDSEKEKNENLQSNNEIQAEQDPTIEQSFSTAKEPKQAHDNEVLKSDANEAIQEHSTLQIKSFDSKFVQTDEDSISFYVRRVSISSWNSEEDTSPKTFTAPPPLSKTIRTIKFAIDEDQGEQSADVPVKGGVPVFVPGLLDAAKNSVQRRLKARSNSPDTNKQPTKLSQTSVNDQTKSFNISNSNEQTWNSNQKNQSHVPQPIDSPSQTQHFVFYPKSPVGSNEHFNKKKGQPIQNVRHEYSASPVLNSPFLLGQSVFKPVKEIEIIRNDFNQRSVSNSRSPSIMSQSDIRANVKKNYYGNDRTTNVSLTFMDNQQQYNHDKWALHDGNNQNVVFPKLPIGITQRVFERKVTEHHTERDTSGKFLNGWKQQDWHGTYEQFRDPNQTPLL